MENEHGKCHGNRCIIGVRLIGLYSGFYSKGLGVGVWVTLTLQNWDPVAMRWPTLDLTFGSAVNKIVLP